MGELGPKTRPSGALGVHLPPPQGDWLLLSAWNASLFTHFQARYQGTDRGPGLQVPCSAAELSHPLRSLSPSPLCASLERVSVMRPWHLGEGGLWGAGRAYVRKLPHLPRARAMGEHL